MKRRPTVLSTFSGAGGLDLGLEAAGFHTLSCIELDVTARQTLAANRPHWSLWKEPDVVKAARKVTPSDLGLRVRELDVLAGGPPCQPFSKAAQWAPRGMAGLDDPRAKTLMAFTTLLERFLPRVMLIENVPGFVMGRTSAVETLARALKRINRKHKTKYALDIRLLNAEEHGVPQARRRAILVATRGGETVAWPAPTPSPTRSFDALVRVQPRTLPEASGSWAWLLPTIPAGQNYLFHTPSGGGEPFFGERRRFWSFLLKLDPARPAWTLPAKPGPSTGPFHWENRPLAIEEMLALQTFPHDWKVSGGRIAQVRQVGNATPPLLAELVGRAIGTSLFSLTYRERPLREVRRATEPLPTLRTAPVPEKLKPKGTPPTPHPGEGCGPNPSRHAVRD